MRFASRARGARRGHRVGELLRGRPRVVAAALALLSLVALAGAADVVGVRRETLDCAVTHRWYRPAYATRRLECTSVPVKGQCGVYRVVPMTRPAAWELEVARPERIGGGSETFLVNDGFGAYAGRAKSVPVSFRVGRFSGHFYDARLPPWSHVDRPTDAL